LRLTEYLAAALVVATAGLTPSSALAQASGSTVSDARVAELLQAVAGGSQQAAPPAGQTRPPTPVTDPTALPITIEEAVAMALEKNLDIAVERLNPTAVDWSIKALEANFNPTATSTVGFNSTYQLPTSQLVGGARVKNDQFTWNFGVQQTLPWSGTSYSVGFNNRRNDNNNAFVTFNPQYNSSLTAQVVQPLLRGRVTDNTRTQLIVTRINRELSEVQLRATVIDTLAAVAMRTGIWCLPSRWWKPPVARSRWPRAWSPTTRIVSKWARWRPSTSFRPRRKLRPAGRPWRNSRHRHAPRT
jgi:hypothetical protein